MTEDSFLEMLDTQMTMVDSYRDLLLSFLEDDDLSSKTWFDLVMSSQFRWLHEKFLALWYKKTAFDDFLTRTRPQYGLFSPTDFEELVQSVMYLLLGKYYETTKNSHDEGIDLIITEQFITHGAEFSATSIVQCKLYRDPVPVSEVRDFFGVMVSRTATGYFFTTSLLSNQAVSKFLPMANASSMANKLHIVTKENIWQLFNICRVMADEMINAYLEKRPLDESLFYSERKKAIKIVQENPPRQTSLF